MVISKVFVHKADDMYLYPTLESAQKVLKEPKDNFKEKALLAYNDGDIIGVYPIEDILEEYHKRTPLETDELSDVKPCPICGNMGRIYFEKEYNIFACCEEHIKNMF